MSVLSSACFQSFPALNCQFIFSIPAVDIFNQHSIFSILSIIIFHYQFFSTIAIVFSIFNRFLDHRNRHCQSPIDNLNHSDRHSRSPIDNLNQYHDSQFLSIVFETSIFIPNRTILVRFGSISGDFGRAMVRILARRSRAKIPMVRPRPILARNCIFFSLYFFLHLRNVIVLRFVVVLL